MTKQDLIRQLGSTTDLARAAGVSPQAVSQWDGESMIPLASAIRVSKSTGLRLHDLRPDMFNDEQSAAENAAENADGDAA